jgi:hypothetical protein
VVRVTTPDQQPPDDITAEDWREWVAMADHYAPLPPEPDKEVMRALSRYWRPGTELKPDAPVDLDALESLYRMGVAEQARYEQQRRDGKQLVEAAQFRPGTDLEYPGTLAESLKRPRPTQRYLIDGLWGVAHNLSVEAMFKTGKTTLLGSAAGALADGTPFLGFATVYSPAGLIGIWNCEMDADDFDDYLVPHVTDRTRIAVAHLRGHPMALATSQAARDEAVKWLRDHGITVWMIDSWTRLCAWNGTDPLDNFGVGKLTAAVDEIKAEAGVTALAVTGHMPHAARTDKTFERSLGAQAFSGWVDGMWRYVRDEGGSRYLSAEGRKVGMAECQVWMDAAGKLVGQAGDREQSAGAALEFTLAMTIQAQPGQSTAALCKATGKRKESTEAVLGVLLARGAVRTQPGARGAVLWFPA